ncbi:MAG TPA: hypothetical protein VKP88_07490 [Candidatus Paceibacterota bacterium]|nr:hypothetical protein [Candidatus Paceibacterota bacterium]
MSEDEARMIRPDGRDTWEGVVSSSCWCSSPDKVEVEFIGTTDTIEAGTVVIASFNAG